MFSNIYSSATTDIGYDLANIAIGQPYNSFQPVKSVSAHELERSTGTFQFVPDFYQKDAKVVLQAAGTELFLAWPSGERSALIPIAHDHFTDRSYWEPVTIERDASGKPSALVYDRFRGLAVKAN